MTLLNNERGRWALTAGVVVLLVLFVLQWSRQPAPATDATLLIQSAAQPSVGAAPAAVAASAVPSIAVDVIGAVQQPGVYYLASDARVVDAVAAAGGLAPDAARDAINLAAALVDGTQIRVPRVGEAAQPSAPAAGAATDGLVNINSADLAALDALPGIGPTTAQAIIDQRTSGGAFTQIDDIQNVKGIGPSLFAQIKARITVGP